MCIRDRLSTRPGSGSILAHSIVTRQALQPSAANCWTSSRKSVASPAPSLEWGARLSRSQVDQSAAGATPSADTADAVTPSRNGSAVGEDTGVDDDPVTDAGLEQGAVAVRPHVDVETFAGKDR